MTIQAWPETSQPGSGSLPPADLRLDADEAVERPRIKLATDADQVRVLTTAVTDGWVPEVYVTNGQLVRITKVSGDVSTAAANQSASPPLPIVSGVMTPDSFASALAHHTFTYRVKTQRTGEAYDEEILPAPRTLATVLSQRFWPGVRELLGIVGSPVLRRDGTLLQRPGYDPRSKLFLAPKVKLPHVPDRPKPEQVRAARGWLLRDFLGDFPWVGDADRANYIGLLVAQILRPYVGSLTPLGLISATTQSSGKTILSEGIGLLYGQRVQPWVNAEGELRKTITSLLAEPASTVVFDNIKEGEVIDSPVLAMLLTTPVWSDRLLGVSQTFSAINDRLWLATGNNIHLGGDLATRTVLIQLDPKMPRPELRTKFAIPNLDRWVKDPANRATMLWHLLVLVMDWIAAGATQVEQAMRQFGPWASATGGFLAHHGIGGFLSNAEAVRGLDEEDAEWTAFLRRWFEQFGSSPRLASDVLLTAEVEFMGNSTVDRWRGDFIKDDAGRIPNAKSFGHKLRGQKGRYHGDFILNSRKADRGDRQEWWVEEYEPDGN